MKVKRNEDKTSQWNCIDWLTPSPVLRVPWGDWLTGCQGPTAAHFPVADGGSQAPSPEQDLTV